MNQYFRSVYYLIGIVLVLAACSPFDTQQIKTIDSFEQAWKDLENVDKDTLVIHTVSAKIDILPRLKHGRIVTWFTLRTPINLELDSIINSMAGEYRVETTTKVGRALLFRKNI